jgi:Cyclin, N-terminal domain
MSHAHGVVKAPIASRPASVHILNPQAGGGARPGRPTRQIKKKRSATSWLSAALKSYKAQYATRSEPEREKAKLVHLMHARFIHDLGQRLQLQQLQISTAQVYFHRFFTVHRFGERDEFIVALAALFLAAKVEEWGRKAKDVLKIGFAVRTPCSPPSFPPLFPLPLPFAGLLTGVDPFLPRLFFLISPSSAALSQESSR